MSQPLRLLAILAHPDDESLGAGGTLAHYAANGVETFLVTATRGQRGRYFHNDNRPSDDAVGRARESELNDAARELGIHNVAVLDFMDGELDSAEPVAAARLLATHIQRVRPQVVLTFGPDGAYGHPDHIAISQLTSAAIVMAAAEHPNAHSVSKLYWIAWPARIWEIYQSAFKRLISNVDGVEREVTPWRDWAITTHIDARAQWPKVWRAVQCHQTQMAVYDKLEVLTDAEHQVLWGEQYSYRVFSTVNGGRKRETDLFEGLR